MDRSFVEMVWSNHMTGKTLANKFEAVNGIAVRREPNKLSRREVVRIAGGIGLATAGVIALGRSAGAQEASPVPSPVLGPQADGTTLWKVTVGSMDMENGIEIHGFFPGEITINAGDSIWFAEEMPGFHTVTFPGPDPVPGIIIPDPEAAASGTPAAGPPKLIINPVVVTGAGGTSVDGSQLVSTTVDVFAAPGTQWIFTFPTAGTYDYVCVPHSSVMQAKVIVQEAGSALPKDQAAYDSEAADAIAALHEQGLAEIEKYSAATPTTSGGATLHEVAVGAGGATQVRVQRFLPGEITITAGDTIKFVNQSEGEPHTATFLGAGETAPEDTLVETFADGSPKFVQSMETFLPQGGNTFSGTGFVNSGFMGIPQLGLPMEWEVTLDTPGEYVVYCILHGAPDGTGMAGKVIVNAAG
jgi:plastocyanin